MTVELEVVNGEESSARVEPLLAEVWTSIEREAPWRDVQRARPSLRLLLETAEDGLVCQASLHFRVILWQGRRMPVGGVGSLSTRPDFRRRGYAGIALAAAVQTMRDRGDLQFLLLFCEPQNEAFYLARGWHQFGGAITMTQPQGPVAFTAMTPLVFDLKRTVRSGAIDLCGLPW
jgi:aminoglycoside 2'-N-acetyltransferase I